MAPVAALSRPPSRPKPRSKIDGRPGPASGLPSLPTLYSARNLDLCTQQLGHWNPFASSAAASPEHAFGNHVIKDGTLQDFGVREEGRQCEPNQSASGTVGASNYGCRNPAPEPGLFRASECGEEGAKQTGIVSSLPVTPQWREYTASVQHHMSQRRRDFKAMSPPYGEAWLNCAIKQGIGKEMSGNPAPRSALEYPPLPSFEFGKTGEYGKSTMMSSAAARSGLPVQGRRIQGWSKRRKLLSHALARGLWRWKDGFHARKRMKRSGPGGAYNSGSDKSSDRAPYGIHASDPSTAPTSKAGPFKWSDFPITPTDSSGELFYFGGGNGSTLQPELNSLAKEWTACGCLRSDGTTAGADCDHCWLGSENNSVESGYGSEPGYRGDEELEFGDADEQDEEEKEPEHLRIWREVMASHGGGPPQFQSSESDHSIIQDQGKHMRRAETRPHDTN